MNFSGKLIEWYHNNKRDLPWRNTKDPYKIWLSEIILQQTRVDQGLAYYKKFVSKYPSIGDLAVQSEQEVLNDWQGLGYYSRARNLLHTAKQISEKHNGIFPNTYEGIIDLKGIGEYTAAAIGSFAYDIPKPVIDGNVYRVLSRIFGISTPIDSSDGKNEFKKLANNLIDSDYPAEYNQAIMEFGAIQCKPLNPICDECPFNSNCEAFMTNKVDFFPVKSKKIKKRIRHFNYLVIKTENEILLKKRTENDIWKNMYDFPLIENEKINTWDDIVGTELWNSLLRGTHEIVQKEKYSYTHLLTHQKINASFWVAEIGEMYNLDCQYYTIANFSDLDNFPLPKLVLKYLESNN